MIENYEISTLCVVRIAQFQITNKSCNNLFSEKRLILIDRPKMPQFNLGGPRFISLAKKNAILSINSAKESNSICLRDLVA